MSHRKILTFTGLLLLVFAIGPAHAETPVPSFPKSGKTTNDFVPAGWKILKRTEGDLNKDNLPDTVLILASQKEDTDAEDGAEAPRPLVILFKQAGGDYVLSAMQPTFIMCKMCGGVFGDPVEDPKIERGTLLISHYGGSNERWGFRHRFRFQDGDWYMIGKTQTYRHNVTGVEGETDINLITGDKVTTDTDEKGKTTTKKSKGPKKPLVKLSQATSED